MRDRAAVAREGPRGPGVVPPGVRSDVRPAAAVPAVSDRAGGTRQASVSRVMVRRRALLHHLMIDGIGRQVRGNRVGRTDSRIAVDSRPAGPI
jgi:hypothetical protein